MNQIGAPATLESASVGKTSRTVPSSIAENASTILIQFSQAKLPEMTSHSCVTIMSVAAIEATGCGAERKIGTPSCTTWLPSTSSRCTPVGSRCANQLTGFGIGCVSW